MVARTLVRGTSLALALLAGAHAGAEIACGKGVVAEFACNDREVRTLMHRVEVESSRLRCPPAGQYELKLVKLGWGRRQYACARSSEVRQCVLDQLRSELEYFKSMKRCDVSAHPVKFETTEPSYVLAHIDVFKGTQIAVMGWIALASCDEDSTSLVGEVHEINKESRGIEIRFKSLSVMQRRFVCEKQPFSTWRGQVMVTDPDKPYLYATDLLGDPLP